MKKTLLLFAACLMLLTTVTAIDRPGFSLVDDLGDGSADSSKAFFNKPDGNANTWKIEMEFTAQNDMEVSEFWYNSGDAVGTQGDYCATMSIRSGGADGSFTQGTTFFDGCPPLKENGTSFDVTNFNITAGQTYTIVINPDSSTSTTGAMARADSSPTSVKGYVGSYDQKAYWDIALIPVNSPPTINSYSVDGANYTKNASFSLDASDADGPLTNEYLNVYKDGTIYAEQLALSDSLNIDEKYINWTFEFVAVGDKGSTVKTNKTIYVDDKFPLLDDTDVLIADSTNEFQNWKNETSNMVIENGGVNLDSDSGYYLTERFKASKSENLYIAVNKTNETSGIAHVIGYDENNSIVETREMNLSFGDNTLDVSGIKGVKYKVNVSASIEDNASSSQAFQVKRLKYTGQLESTIAPTVITKTQTITETVTKGFFESIGFPKISLPKLPIPDLSGVLDSIASIPSQILNNLGF